jgi:hypothetical protein
VRARKAIAVTSAVRLGEDPSPKAASPGTSRQPAASDFVHRYADTFQPHEFRCCSFTPYVRRGAPASGVRAIAGRPMGSGPLAHM